MNLIQRHEILRRAVKINIPRKHVTFNPTLSTIKQGSSLNQSVPNTPPTLSPKMSSNKCNLKINWNTETGQRLVESAKSSAEEAANDGIIDPIQMTLL